jgi:Mce-associated membrane protein
VEDQQPSTGDLTAEASAEPEVADETARAEVEPAETGESADTTESTDAATESTEDTPSVEAPGKAKRTRRFGGRLVPAAIVLATVLFVGSAAFAGATLQPYLADRATAATKMRVARTAANAITTLWTYTPENMDHLADRAAVYLSGDFEAQYRKFVDGIVAPNRQAKISNNTEVTGAAVESLEGKDAVVIIYTNTTSTSPLTKNIPSLKYLSYRLFLQRQGKRWLVNRMTTITSLDLTPHV